MTQILKDALVELDVMNDEHWTQEGSPRLDVLKAKTGENVTRADIHAISKVFNRSNPAIDEVDETITEATSWGAKVGEATNEKRVEVEGDTLEGNPEDEEPNVVTNDLTDEEYAEAKLVEARLALHEATNAFHVAQESVNFFRIKREKREKAVPAHTMIQAYQLSQSKQRASDNAKTEQLRKLAMGLDSEDRGSLKNGLNDIL